MHAGLNGSPGSSSGSASSGGAPSALVRMRSQGERNYLALEKPSDLVSRQPALLYVACLPALHTYHLSLEASDDQTNHPQDMMANVTSKPHSPLSSIQHM